MASWLSSLDGARWWRSVPPPLPSVSPCSTTGRSTGDPSRYIDFSGAAIVSVLIGSFVFEVNRLPVDGVTVAIAPVATMGWLTAPRTTRDPNVCIPRAVAFDLALAATGIIGVIASAVYLARVCGGASRAVSRIHEVGAVGIGLTLAPMADSMAVASTLNSRAQEWLGRSIPRFGHYSSSSPAPWAWRYSGLTVRSTP